VGIHAGRMSSLAHAYSRLDKCTRMRLRLIESIIWEAPQIRRSFRHVQALEKHGITMNEEYTLQFLPQQKKKFQFQQYPQYQQQLYTQPASAFHFQPMRTQPSVMQSPTPRFFDQSGRIQPPPVQKTGEPFGVKSLPRGRRLGGFMPERCVVPRPLLDEIRTFNSRRLRHVPRPSTKPIQMPREWRFHSTKQTGTIPIRVQKQQQQCVLPANLKYQILSFNRNTLRHTPRRVRVKRNEIPEPEEVGKVLGKPMHSQNLHAAGIRRITVSSTGVSVGPLGTTTTSVVSRSIVLPGTGTATTGGFEAVKTSPMKTSSAANDASPGRMRTTVSTRSPAGPRRGF